jgi:carboxynorspermidine decarboxylase
VSVQTPVYICEEKLLRNNLELLDRVQQESDVKIILALKGFAMWSTFDLVSEYLYGITASGLNEAKLGREKMNKEVHTYSPAFKEDEIEEILDVSDHIVFNSLNQLEKFGDLAQEQGVSVGLRVNPETSSSPVELYNPCGLYSRFGVLSHDIDPSRMENVDGLHFHALCEQDADALAEVLESFEEKFGFLLSNMKWVNFGGGHHITRKDYDVDGLIRLLKAFRSKYPHLEVYLEPGEAVGWQTGTLVATVIDIVHNGIDIAIVDTSAEAHMPDVLAMPYHPDVRGAGEIGEKTYSYRFGGNSCLAGDIIGDYSFDAPLKVGSQVIFEDMIHYSFVKNTTFNGIPLPSLAILRENGDLEMVKTFGYDTYKNRLS